MDEESTFDHYRVTMTTVHNYKQFCLNTHEAHVYMRVLSPLTKRQIIQTPCLATARLQSHDWCHATLGNLYDYVDGGCMSYIHRVARTTVY